MRLKGMLHSFAKSILSSFNCKTNKNYPFVTII